MHIVIISGSIREGRKSHRAAIFLLNSITQTANTAEILDLKEYAFPLFHERLRYQKDPDARVVDFAERVRRADGVILVTPEYNGGYPASVKNIVDLLTDEWKRKPLAICTCSDGSFGGTQVITSLLFSLWKIKAWVVAHMPVPKVGDAFAADGTPAEPEAWAKRAHHLMDELGWAMEARRRMEA
ncbi:MAG: NAD(P)H-dependent oxidoreductase [Flavobacteriales bacterium]|nr:NAD(P)H-dependent oxidoreductase [Flavobacteriales bacterium]MCC6938552.1 NAD(P)H-dependent oxidoreductase [Flavobacteriales bacterium]